MLDNATPPHQTTAGRQLTAREESIARAHNSMADEYDQLDDYWYPWLFARMHEFIAGHLPISSRDRPKALDAGCGTGFQSFLLARAGFDVDAFDVADDLVRIARQKASQQAQLPLEAPPLFTTCTWNEASRHAASLAVMLERVRANRTVTSPRFFVADLNSADLGQTPYDAITCCGSVLSFVNDYRAALKRLADTLAPDGRMFIEVEQKTNLDLLWPIADRLTRGRLGYDQSWTTIASGVFLNWGRSVDIEYPFELHDGKELVLPMRLFAVREFEDAIAAAGLRIVDRIGIHITTNLLPSTVLHHTTLNRAVRTIFRALCRVDSSVERSWPAWRLGCSIVYCLRKSEPCHAG